MDAWVVEVLREGYQIPFLSPPPLSSAPVSFDSYAPGSIRGRALEVELEALVEKGTVELAPPTPGFYSRMFVVLKASGAWRPIISSWSVAGYLKFEVLPRGKRKNEILWMGYSSSQTLLSFFLSLSRE